jgi:MFS family permease
MSTAALSSRAVSRPAVNPWIVAAAVVIPTFMEVVDTTIANVAQRYIAGGLSAAVIDSEWVITSYLAANAFILPITGWLSAHFGRRNYFLLSIAVFTLASALCGMATSLPQLILFRVLQGLAGGGLQPSSQGVLLDAFPPEKQGAAQTMFGVAALLGPVVGPTLGGWLVVTYNWRWIFYINVPVGILAFLACHALLEDPDYLRQQRAELRKRPLNFDGIGLGLLALVMASWEVVLSKGQEWDWLSDPFWRVQALLAVFVLGLAGLLYRELTFANPVINFRVLRERNFALCCVIIFFAFAVLYQSSVALPGLLQSLFGYDAFVSGLVLSPAGLFAILMLVVVGALLGRGVDRHGPAGRGGGKLLDVADEPPDQPMAGGLAACVVDRRPVVHFRAAERRRLPVRAETPARGGGGPAGPASQRRRQFRHLDVADHPGAASGIPQRARRRIPRPAQSPRNDLSGQRPGVLLSANRRLGRVPDDGRASVGEPPPAASSVAGILRCLLGGRRPGCVACAAGVVDEAIGCREG